MLLWCSKVRRSHIIAGWPLLFCLHILIIRTSRGNIDLVESLPHWALARLNRKEHNRHGLLFHLSCPSMHSVQIHIGSLASCTVSNSSPNANLYAECITMQQSCETQRQLQQECQPSCHQPHSSRLFPAPTHASYSNAAPPPSAPTAAPHLPTAHSPESPPTPSPPPPPSPKKALATANETRSAPSKPTLQKCQVSTPLTSVITEPLSIARMRF